MSSIRRRRRLLLLLLLRNKGINDRGSGMRIVRAGIIPVGRDLFQCAASGCLPATDPLDDPRRRRDMLLSQLAVGEAQYADVPVRARDEQGPAVAGPRGVGQPRVVQPPRHREGPVGAGVVDQDRVVGEDGEDGAVRQGGAVVAGRELEEDGIGTDHDRWLFQPGQDLVRLVVTMPREQVRGERALRQPPPRAGDGRRAGGGASARIRPARIRPALGPAPAMPQRRGHHQKGSVGGERQPSKEGSQRQLVREHVMSPGGGRRAAGCGLPAVVLGG
mmetsp:Transcript_10059/g.24627  ORF Transcript_10059/g.24627 Transcript_10059/m.24627 type:complete len:275 (-) Transcript_10059:167-991(-)